MRRRHDRSARSKHRSSFFWLSMSTALAKSDSISLELSGVTLTRHSLEIEDQQAFHRAGNALAAMDSCSQWWWGDYLLFAEKYDLGTVLDQQRPDLHHSTINSFIHAARFYAIKDRHPGLSFTHHQAVMYSLGEDGSITEARKWLERAASKKWTVGDLREAMRMEKRKSEGDPGPMRGVVRITDFVKISRFCATVKVAELPADEIAEIRRSSQPLFNFLCEIHRSKFG